MISALLCTKYSVLSTICWNTWHNHSSFTFRLIGVTCQAGIPGARAKAMTCGARPGQPVPDLTWLKCSSVLVSIYSGIYTREKSRVATDAGIPGAALAWLGFVWGFWPHSTFSETFPYTHLPQRDTGSCCFCTLNEYYREFWPNVHNVLPTWRLPNNNKPFLDISPKSRPVEKRYSFTVSSE